MVTSQGRLYGDITWSALWWHHHRVGSMATSQGRLYGDITVSALWWHHRVASMVTSQGRLWAFSRHTAGCPLPLVNGASGRFWNVLTNIPPGGKTSPLKRHIMYYLVLDNQQHELIIVFLLMFPKWRSGELLNGSSLFQCAITVDVIVCAHCSPTDYCPHTLGQSKTIRYWGHFQMSTTISRISVKINK